MTYHYHGIDAEESILTKSLPKLGTWALPNLFFIRKYCNYYCYYVFTRFLHLFCGEANTIFLSRDHIPLYLCYQGAS